MLPSLIPLPSALIKRLRALGLFQLGDKVHEWALPIHPYEGFIHWMRGARCFISNSESDENHQIPPTKDKIFKLLGTQRND